MGPIAKISNRFNIDYSFWQVCGGQDQEYYHEYECGLGYLLFDEGTFHWGNPQKCDICHHKSYLLNQYMKS